MQQAKPLGVKAVILAGGLGTRLGDLTKTLPKPMVEVNGKPFLEHLIAYLKRLGISYFIVSVGYRKEAIIDYFGDGSKFGVQIEYAVEQKPSGTAVGVKLASAKAGKEFFLLNGDSFVEFDPLEMLAIMKKQRAKCVITVNQETEEKNNLRIENGKIIEYHKGGKGMEYMNCGVCLLSKECIPLLASTGSYEESLFSSLIKTNELSFCKVGNCLDMGTLDGLEKARGKLK